jgi:hypothetical protein
VRRNYTIISGALRHEGGERILCYVLFRGVTERQRRRLGEGEAQMERGEDIAES